MKLKLLFVSAIYIISIGSILIFARFDTNSTNALPKIEEPLKTSGAGEALDMWTFERAYPNSFIPASKYIEAFEETKLMAEQSSEIITEEWQSLGPENIGGRTLCLAFHPTNPDIIYAGSASGGLWKTTTQGQGQYAWEKVPTGFPVLGVAAIVIDPTNPNKIIIGTGETYGSGLAEPGTINRLARGTYGIGILKSEDGGVSWDHVLVFNQNELKGVQDLEINPLNTLEIYAATTDGIYRSLNGGDSWILIFAQPNCIDLEIDPTNGDVLYVSQGNFNSALDPNLSGIFKSTDKGNSFTELLDPGLLTAWSGNAKLSIDPGNSNIIYASIQFDWFNTDPTTPGGIFKSINGGVTWTNINNQNIALYQGWYSHDIAINPMNPSELMYVGINAWKSTDSGSSFIIKSWNFWTMGEVPVGIPEGNEAYVHSDIHAVYYHPINNKVFMASDGGVFVSEDGDTPFTTLNGGLQTTQFYADMGSSAQTPNFCIAGAQDNASYEYKGNPSWWRVIGGDGMSASVNQSDGQVVYGSSQGLNLRKSLNGGTSFFGISPPLVSGDYTAFSAPYILAPSNQDIIYAGGTYLYKSEEAGTNWNPTSGQSVDGANVIVKIAVSPANPNIVYVATAPYPFSGSTQSPKIFKSENGGSTFTELLGFPNRICKDIEIDPSNDANVYVTFSGFGTSHVYKSFDSGATWSPIDTGLPDVPTNTILIDPINSDDIYVGNDLGVYYSENGGSSWESFSIGLPEAVMIYDLNDSPANRKVRIATHGHGIWQANYVNDPLAIADPAFDSSFILLYPNPASELVTVFIKKDFPVEAISVYNALGKLIITIASNELNQQGNNILLDISNYSSGVYFVKVISENNSMTKTLIVQSQ